MIIINSRFVSVHTKMTKTCVSLRGMRILFHGKLDFAKQLVFTLWVTYTHGVACRLIGAT